ncbi:hypothetical protein IG631_09182 [Alternaria alternata]|jgi:hypothetical protein|nr:hypothetical protein IG631_09182 [Alternaria alternata]
MVGAHSDIWSCLRKNLAARAPKLTRRPWHGAFLHPLLFMRLRTTRYSMANELSMCYWSIVLHARPAKVLAFPRSSDLNGRFSRLLRPEPELQLEQLMHLHAQTSPSQAD